MSAVKYEVQQLQPFFIESTPIRETPSKKYAAYHTHVHSNGLASLPRTYFTTTITSGGYNVFADHTQPKLDVSGSLNFLSIVKDVGAFPVRTPFPGIISYPEVLAGNTKLAEAFRVGLLDSGKVSTENSLLIFPPDLGKVPGWTQFDYNLFWLDVISGLDPKDAGEIESAFKSSRFDFNTYNNGKLPNEVKKPIYLEFVQSFLQMIDQKGFRVDPISEFVQLVDPKGSLGGFVEEFLAKSLGVHISRAVINNLKSFSRKNSARALIRQGIEIPAASLSDNQEDTVSLISQPELI